MEQRTCTAGILAAGFRLGGSRATPPHAHTEGGFPKGHLVPPSHTPSDEGSSSFLNSWPSRLLAVDFPSLVTLYSPSDFGKIAFLASLSVNAFGVDFPTCGDPARFSSGHSSYFPSKDDPNAKISARIVLFLRTVSQILLFPWRPGHCGNLLMGRALCC